MSIFDVFHLALNSHLHLVLAGIAVALAFPIAKSINDPSVRDRRSRCPLWIALPFALLAATSPIGLSVPGVEQLFGVVSMAPPGVWLLLQAALLAWQGTLSVQAIRAHNEWRSTTVPFVLLLGVWILPVALADLALVGGPMVK
jgi:hypothetical protein